MTRLEKMIFEKGKAEGREEGKKEGQKELRLEAAKNLIGLLDEKIIAERISLPLEIVKKLKEETLN